MLEKLKPLILLVLVISCTSEQNTVPQRPEPTPQPPFSGTIFLDPDIITADDSSAFVSITAKGKGERTIYDRRVNDWITIFAHLFYIQYADGLTMEAQVNPEFSDQEAAIEAEKYARAVGLLTTSLRIDVDALWINKGTELYGGGNRSILIHTGQTVEYERDGILEETLVHEATHTSLDDPHATHSGWLQAQEADNNYISTYARDYPLREDLAETYLLHLSLRHRRERISVDLANTILETIPNRLEYLDNLALDMYPIVIE